MQANFLLTGQPETFSGSRIARVEGAKAQTLTGFYSEIARVLEFPDYFGFNLDSLDELLNDLSWIKEQKVVIFIADSDCFFANETNPGILNKVLLLLDEAAGSQQGLESEPICNILRKELKVVFSPGERMRQVLQNMDIKFEVL